MKEWHFFDKVFRVWVTLLIGPATEYAKFMERVGYTGSKDWEGCSGFCVRLDPENCTGGSRATIIWLPKYETAAVVHEIVHLMVMTFTDKGVPLADPNQETMAYYVEYWFNEINRVRKRLPNGRLPKDVRH
jgi:hypothetical protein